MNSKKLWSLVKKGRLVPVVKTIDGEEKVVEFTRKSSSRKRNQSCVLKEPISLSKKNAPES